MQNFLLLVLPHHYTEKLAITWYQNVPQINPYSTQKVVLRRQYSFTLNIFFSESTILQKAER